VFRIAKARERVEIQRAIVTPSATGAPDERWETIVSTRAWVEELTGSQMFYNDHLGHSTSHRVHMRYRKDVWQEWVDHTALRVLWGVQVLDIRYVSRGANAPYDDMDMLCDVKLDVEA